ncbi:uncharacterized protein METZ01_LOCUS189950, partial [marine metagenome]
MMRSLLVLFFAFCSVVYSGYTITAVVIDANENDLHLPHVTGYFNGGNNIRITVVIDGDDATNFSQLQVGVCFTNSAETPADDHANFATLGDYQFDPIAGGSRTVQIDLNRSTLIASYQQLSDDDYYSCGNLCANGYPRFDIWIKLLTPAMDADGRGWLDVNFNDNNALESTDDEDDTDAYLVYDIWVNQIHLELNRYNGFQAYNNYTFSRQEIQFEIWPLTLSYGGADYVIGGQLSNHNGTVQNILTMDPNTGPTLTYVIGTVDADSLTRSGNQTVVSAPFADDPFIHGRTYDYSYHTYDAAGNSYNPGTIRHDVQFDNQAPLPIITGLIGDGEDPLTFTGVITEGQFVNDDNPIYLKIQWQESDGTDEPFDMQSFPVGDIGIDNATLGNLVSPTEENDYYYVPVTLSDNGVISAQ